MKLINRILGRRYAPIWEHSPGATVWKLQPTTPSGILFGESRDTEAKETTIFALRPSTGKLLYSGIALDEPWWIALEMTIGDVAIFHRFPKPDLPNAMGTVAVNCTDGSILWSNNELRVLCGIEELALVQRGESLDWSNLALIDIRTGAVLEEIGEHAERVAGFQEACSRTTLWDGWINSAQIDPETPEGIEVLALLKGEITDLRGPVEYRRHGPVTAVTASTPSRRGSAATLNNLVDTHLLLFSEGRVIHRDTLAQVSPSAVGDLFFIWNDLLIAIRDRSTLVCYDLREQHEQR